MRSIRIIIVLTSVFFLGWLLGKKSKPYESFGVGSRLTVTFPCGNERANRCNLYVYRLLSNPDPNQPINQETWVFEINSQVFVAKKEINTD